MTASNSTNATNATNAFTSTNDSQTMPILAITAGEPAGIGPDLCVQIAQQAWDYQILVICDKQVLVERAKQLGLPLEVSDFDENLPAQAHTRGHLWVRHVPLAQAVIAGELNTANSRYVFPSVRSNKTPMSNNTVRLALRTMGYDSETMSAHGFRTTASTLLNEQGWSPDAIERQLAHSPRNKVRAAYNRAQYLEERVKMMQAWADYLGTLKTDANVIPFKRAS